MATRLLACCLARSISSAPPEGKGRESHPGPAAQRVRWPLWRAFLDLLTKRKEKTVLAETATISDGTAGISLEKVEPVQARTCNSTHCARAGGACRGNEHYSDDEVRKRIQVLGAHVA